MKQVWRHDLEFHSPSFCSVVVITQLSLENGEPLFDVKYDDLVEEEDDAIESENDYSDDNGGIIGDDDGSDDDGGNNNDSRYTPS